MKCLLCKEEIPGGGCVFTHPELDVSFLVFSHDSSDKSSWKTATDELTKQGFVMNVLCRHCQKEL